MTIIKLFVRNIDNKLIIINDLNINEIKTFTKFIRKLNLGYKFDNKKFKIIFNNIIITPNNYKEKFINNIVSEKINNIKNEKHNNTKYEKTYNIEIIPILKGGFIMDVINAVVNIFKLLVGIPKLILFILRFILWLIKFFIYMLGMLFGILDKDGFLALIKYIAGEILLAPFKFIIIYIKKFVNNLGNLTFIALSGADNVQYHDEKEPTEFHSSECYQEKCYRTSDGLVPFSVIITTILCPPLGVFMEYGLTGWFNILICGLLTLAFYFPGLIYGLILLYC
jgi:uncharacterized membrane protein YqaE (UPF0057 family)